MCLIIKGMDVPKDDYKHRHLTLDRSTDDGVLRMSFLTFDREAWKYSCGVYSVSELPTPHGRLIDADKLHSILLDMWQSDCNRSFIDAIREVGGMPTIIEAEE